MTAGSNERGANDWGTFDLDSTILARAVVKLILIRTMSIIPIGEVDSVDDCWWSKVDRPPRIRFRTGDCTGWRRPTAGGFIVAVVGEMC